VEWWLEFRGDASNLRKVVCVLSQATTSSSCKCNWSTFTMIHTKVRNKLSYRRLEKLVYIHCNMRLRCSVPSWIRSQRNHRFLISSTSNTTTKIHSRY
ncbi:hypothetical protein BHM03_00020964, partial [Ensete ventricosum]